MDLKDYGGYKSKMNSKGGNITDIWTGSFDPFGGSGTTYVVAELKGNPG